MHLYLLYTCVLTLTQLVKFGCIPVTLSDLQWTVKNIKIDQEKTEIMHFIMTLIPHMLLCCETLVSALPTMQHLPLTVWLEIN